MTKKRPPQEIEQLFITLYEESLKENAYSLIEIAVQLNIDYALIVEWAQSNEFCKHVFDLSRQSCFCNAQDAGLESRIDYEKFIRYSAENLEDDDEEKARYLKEIQKIDQENFDKSEKEIVMSEEIKQKEGRLEVKVQSYTDKEEARINEWRKKKNDINLRFKIKPDSTYNPETKVTSCTVKKEWDEDVTEDQKYYLDNATFCAATGSASREYAGLFLTQTINALGKADADTFNALLPALLSMKPADEYEGMLISRLIVLHQQYMNYMGLAETNKNNRESRESYINSATKLMRVYNETLEALNKYRRKGEQKVTVTHNHVNVNEGGKAIVGSEINQQAGGGDNDKK